MEPDGRPHDRACLAPGGRLGRRNAPDDPPRGRNGRPDDRGPRPSRRLLRPRRGAAADVTSAIPRPAPIRRSPLEPVHQALGATWISNDVRWPVAYGEVATEAAAVAASAGLADLGPIDKVVLRGRR